MYMDKKKEYYEKNKEKIKEKAKAKEYRQDNKEIIKENQKKEKSLLFILLS